MDTDKSVTQALILEVVSDIRLHMRRLVDLTERSLQVRCQGFEAYSRFELMTQESKASAARKRHAEIAALGPGGAEWAQQESDARFQLQAAEDVLAAMYVSNHDAGRSIDPYWNKARVENFAKEYAPGGKRWVEHHERRKNHIRDSRTRRDYDQQEV